MALAGSGRGGQGLEGDGVGRQGVGRTHLGFDANLHDGTRDGEHVTGDQKDVPACIGGGVGGEWIHVYVWLSPLAVHLKLPQHC